MRWLSARMAVLCLLLSLGAQLVRCASVTPVLADEDVVLASPLDLGKLHELAKRLNRFGDDLPDPSLLFMERIVAYEEHDLFSYVVARSGPLIRPWDPPVNEWRVVCLKPHLLLCLRIYREDAGVGYPVLAPSDDSELVMDDQGRELLFTHTSLRIRARLLWPASARIAKSTQDGTSRRATVIASSERLATPVRMDVWLVQIGDGGPLAPPPATTVEVENASLSVTVKLGRGTFQLELPADGSDPGEILFVSGEGNDLPRRPLPAGILPHGEEGAAMIQRWDRAYAPGNIPPWDTGRPDSHLREAVASGVLNPCPTIEFGCGTGTNAIFLAGEGFDVIGLDVAPRAIAIARRKAQEAGVQARFYLADVLNLPEGLPQVDLVFDRGCYHGVRRFAADRYVRSLLRVTHSGSLVFILAGNANEERHYGPPRVTEVQLVNDFAKEFAFLSLRTVRFDTREHDRAGALGWVVLLRRR